MAFGVQLRLTSTGQSASNINIDDLRQDARRRGAPPEFQYIPAPVPGQPLPFINVTYGDRVPMSFERGDIRGYINGGYITARFLFGPPAQQGATGTVVVTGPTYAAGLDDRYIFVCRDPAGATTITLPPAATSQTGFVQVIDATGDAATNNITIAPAAGDTVAGGASLVINTNNGVADLRSDCISNWFDISTAAPAPTAAGAALLWGASTVSFTTTTRYLYPFFDNGLAQTVAIRYRVPRAGTIRNLRVRHTTPGGNGNAIVYTLRVNGVASGLTTSLASTGTDASDLVTSVVVAAGDLVDIEITKVAGIAGSPNDVVATAEFA